jgi:hypothetical protein
MTELALIVLTLAVVGLIVALRILWVRFHRERIEWVDIDYETTLDMSIQPGSVVYLNGQKGQVTAVEHNVLKGDVYGRTRVRARRMES